MDFSNLNVLLKYNNANSNSSDEYSNATSHFTTVFTANIIKYDA